MNPETGKEDPIRCALSKYRNGQDSYSKRYKSELAVATAHAKRIIEEYIHEHRDHLEKVMEEKRMQEQDTEEEEEEEVDE